MIDSTRQNCPLHIIAAWGEIHILGGWRA